MRKKTAVPDIRDMIRQRVRMLRAEHGWSAQQLVNAMNGYGVSTTRPTLSNFENGSRAEISFTEAIAMALALEVPLTSLIGPHGSGASVLLGGQRRQIGELVRMLSLLSQQFTISLDPDLEQPGSFKLRVVEEPN